MPTNVLVLNKSWLVTGAGAPEGVHAGPVGSVYMREDGGIGTSLYIKESGTGNTGWKAVTTSAQGGEGGPHATTHSAGQTDPVTVTNLAGYPGGSTTFLRADGAFATPATGLAASPRLLGRGTAGSGVAEELTIGSGLVMTGTQLSAPGARNSALVNYTFSTNTTETLIAGQVKLNAAHPYTGVTKIWMRTVSSDGQDVYWGVMVISPGSSILVQDKDDHTMYGRFTTTALPIDKGTYVEIPVTWQANGTAIANNAAVLMQSTAITTQIHATTHKAGGTDAIKLDELGAPTDITTLNASTATHGLLPKLPGTTTTFLRGDGTYTTPTATPGAHATTHKSGGADVIKLDELAAPTDITTLNASTSAHGLLKKLSNIGTQYLDGQGNWTAPTTVPAAHKTTHQDGGTDELALDGSQITTGTVVAARLPTTITSMGQWQAIPFNAANFMSDPGTWTVGSGAIQQNRYALVGKTMFWSIYVSWFSGSNTITGAPMTLYVQHPSVTFIGPTYGVVAYGIDAGALTDLVAYPDGGGWIGFIKKNGAAFTAGTSTGFVSMMTWEIA